MAVSRKFSNIRNAQPRRGISRVNVLKTLGRGITIVYVLKTSGRVCQFCATYEAALRCPSWNPFLQDHYSSEQRELADFFFCSLPLYLRGSLYQVPQPTPLLPGKNTFFVATPDDILRVFLKTFQVHRVTRHST